MHLYPAGVDATEIAKALSSATRLRILELLKDPRGNFTSRREGDLSDAGVCVSLIAAKVGVSQPTATRHLDVLRSAGLLDTERVGQWTFHRRDQDGIRHALAVLRDV